MSRIHWPSAMLLSVLLILPACDSTQGPSDSQEGDSWRWLHPLPDGVSIDRFWGDGEPQLLWRIGLPPMRLLNNHWVTDSRLPEFAPECINSPVDMWYRRGENAVAWHFNGVSSTPFPVETTERLDPTLHAVWGFGAQHLFAAVDEDIWEYDRGWWTSTHLAWVRDLWGSSPEDMWAVYGEDIYHFDGRDWRVDHTAEGQDFHELAGFGPDEVYALDPNGTIAHYDGQQWTLLPAPDFPESVAFDFFFANNPDDILLSSWLGAMAHWDGSAWTELEPSLGYVPRVAGIWGDRQGGFLIYGGYGLRLRYDGETLRSDLTVEIASNSNPYTSLPTLEAVAARSLDDIYVLHGGFDFGSADAIYHFDGAHWAEEDLGLGAVTLYDMDEHAGSIFVAGKGGVLLENGGGGWSAVPTGASSDYRSLSVVSPDTLFLGTDTGQVRILRGAQWEQYDLPDNSTVAVIHALAGSLAYAFGYKPQVYRFDGTAWTVDWSGQDAGIWPRCLLDDGEHVYLVTQTALLRRDPDGWTLISTLPGEVGTAVGDGTGGLILAGNPGKVYRYREGTWSTDPGISGGSFTDMVALPGGEVVLVGGAATVLAYGP